ncbi:MAG: bifunctional glutamate N-acetyltransferase/amino-acid acetyltransferase ArgJ [bacterium]
MKKAYLNPILKAGITFPQGYTAAGVNCGLKKDKTVKDLMIIYSKVPAVAAGTFTTNLVKAAPVLVDIEHLKSGKAQAIVANSKNANACTGKQGLEDARKMASLTAKELSIPAKSVLVASTGVIGQPMPMPKIRAGIKQAAKSLSVSGAADAMQAIMTTDTFSKEVGIEFKIDGKPVRLAGIAKGAGMIAPTMTPTGLHATMLCFLTTDAVITHEALSTALSYSVDHSFNQITVDGDMSTNDTAIILANGMAGNKIIIKNSAGFQRFKEVLTMVNTHLASLIAKDGEGATKLVTIFIRNARTETEAKQIGFTIANSPLVKTALFGNDANWGRIMAAIGRSGIPVNPDKIDISFCSKSENQKPKSEITLVKKGLGTGYSEAKAKLIMKSSELHLIIDLHQGKAGTRIQTCDFSFDYIKINASYRS